MQCASSRSPAWRAPPPSTHPNPPSLHFSTTQTIENGILLNPHLLTNLTHGWGYRMCTYENWQCSCGVRARGLTLASMPVQAGDYRRLLHRPGELQWALLRYADPHAALTAPDSALARGAPEPLAGQPPHPESCIPNPASRIPHLEHPIARFYQR